jgi:hypothetical protein
MKFMRKEILQNVATPMKEYDVIVAGGGPAAIGAALAAAKAGASTAILESRSQFGGTATAGLWMCINWLYSDNDETDRGGIHKILVDKIKSYGEMASRPGKRAPNARVDGGNLDVHPEYLKAVLFELFEQFDVDYMLYSPVTGVIMDGNAVTGVETTGKEGIIPFHGKVIIDATGDGDVAFRARCEMIEGREEDGCHMPASLLFALAGVDTEKLFDYLYEKDGNKAFRVLVSEERAKGEYCLTSWYGFDKTTLPGVVSINNGGCADLSLDGAKTSDLTALERLGIEIAIDFVDFVKEKKIPGMENAVLMRTGSYVAVRDTRRLVGEYVLTEDDIMKGTEFDDRIVRKYGYMDAVGIRVGEQIKQGTSYPFRSLVPKRVENLLVAGRCGSASFFAHTGGKSMGNMLAIGQGAGVAAALAAKRAIPVRNVDVGEVQEQLRAAGVDI